ncbi:DNA topoisomerase III [Serratia fonticola]|uniref:DNA topoisomerase III n=1 Tax=Serratia fonticola TaxID=47917 RepID=UPI001376797C|nr:DNA topoisomerase III [Serratia fonticola]NCG54494.1 DNA topoisomerase III [Serratia fonticola]
MQLFLCEKPSQGKDIAAVLGARQRGNGMMVGNGYVVTWAFGHLLEQVPPEHYGAEYGPPWRLEVLPVLPQRWQLAVKEEASAQFAVIKKLLAQADSVVLATDADREGEVLGREILETCGYCGPLERLWISALDTASIQAGLANLQPGANTLSLYHAGLARSRADWTVGMNMTRLYTLLGAQGGYDGVLSVGRVQTATLRLVVDRDRLIAGFVPKPWWQVWLTLGNAGQPAFRVQWVPAAAYCDEEKRCLQQAVAQQVVQLCQQSGQAQVHSLRTERKNTSAPRVFDLSTLQQVCSKKWDMAVSETLGVAQALYETHKATTYPRTDCGYLPTSMLSEVPDVLAALEQSDPSLLPVLAQLDRQQQSRVWDDKKVTAHHGIIPTRQACDLSKMSAVERRVYDLIRTHYLAQFLPAYQVDKTTVVLLCGGQVFTASGDMLIDAGWKTLFTDEPAEEAEKDAPAPRQLPPLQEGMAVAVQQAEVQAKVTSPPEPYTPGTLLGAMKNVSRLVTDPRLKAVLKENAGLGTEATRAEILNVLQARQFVVKKKKYLQSTPVGQALCDALPISLQEPGLTALWEQALDDIEAGRMTLETFMARQYQWVQQLVVQAQGKTVNIPMPPSPPCPVCGGKMRQRKGPKGAFWSCLHYPECKGGHAVPGSGKGASPRKRKKPA